MAFQDFIYLSEEDYNTLRTNGTAIVNGVELTYNEKTQYYVPDNTEELIGDMQAEITAYSTKVDGFQKVIDNLTLEANYPVGSRYTQYPDEPEPAERFGGNWELDEDAMDKFLIGAGNLYALGTTGGSAEHYHKLPSGYISDTEANQCKVFDSAWGATESTVIAKYGNWRINRDAIIEDEVSIMQDCSANASTIPPYLAVNIWKRTA